MIPNANTSTLLSYGFPFIISGAIQNGFPTTDILRDESRALWPRSTNLCLVNLRFLGEPSENDRSANDDALRGDGGDRYGAVAAEDEETAASLCWTHRQRARG